MKKNCIVVFILLSVLLLMTFASCKTNNQEDKPQDVVVADFEQWTPDFQLIRIYNEFGRVTENTDTRYVKSGKKSAKLEVVGNPSYFGTPTMMFPLISGLLNIANGELKNIDRITIEIYNAQKTDMQVTMGLVTNVLNISNIETTADESVVIAPGWNQLVYYVDFSILGFFVDTTSFEGVYLKFDKSPTCTLEDASIFYIDDLIMHATSETIDITAEITQRPYEICDFENIYEKHVVYTTSQKPEIQPVINSVLLSDYDIPAVGGIGRRALRVECPPGSVPNATWPKVIISPKVIQSAIDALTEDDLTLEYLGLCVDVYNANETERVVYMDVLNTAGSVHYARADVIPPKKWTTIIVPVSGMIDKNTGKVLPSAHFSYAEFVGEGQDVYFLDNYRFETDYRPFAYEGYNPNNARGN